MHRDGQVKQEPLSRPSGIRKLDTATAAIYSMPQTIERDFCCCCCCLVIDNRRQTRANSRHTTSNVKSPQVQSYCLYSYFQMLKPIISVCSSNRHLIKSGGNERGILGKMCTILRNIITHQQSTSGPWYGVPRTISGLAYSGLPQNVVNKRRSSKTLDSPKSAI